ncbi:MAG: U32 family peptidase [Candidatus Methanoperedens sp.]|nr:U32 family peptidase [Candidatus Methanoperedens sp.]
MHKPELLAPVGSKEALIAAIGNGADAVYFGGTLFSARQFAYNFTNEELEWAIDYAHIRGVRAYVTVNTLVKDTELEKAGEYLHFLCNAGADAVIVQDIGILRLLREQLPALPVHASTQMTIHNIEGAKFLQEMGVKRIVLAREMSLDEISRIKSQSSIEIETFIHGALCFSYSGQCLLSSMIGGRSGNRGYCAQPCRKKYRIGEVEGYLLSPRDLNMSEHIGALMDAGIDSFKIEGRMKRPEYVAGVVRVYRKLIDRYPAAPADFRVTKDEKHTLLQLFNREFTTGYFFGNPAGKLMSRKYPHNRGTMLGKTVDYDARTKLVSIDIRAPLRIGDGIGIGNWETGITVRNIYIGNKIATEAATGSTVKIPLDIEVTENEVVYKTFDSKLMASLERNARKIPIKMSFKAKIGELPGLLIDDGENKVSMNGNIVNPAKTTPVSKSSIAEQLIKLGNTIFEAKEVDFELDKNIFIPISELNSIRRSAIEELTKIRARKWKKECGELKISFEQRKFEIKPRLAVNMSSVDCLEAAVDGGADVIYIGNESFAKEKYYEAIQYAHTKGVKYIISTPRIVKDLKELDILDTQSNPDIKDPVEIADGFLVANLGVLQHLRTNFANKPIVIDYPLNIFNRQALDYFLNFSQRVTLSPELTLNEIRELAQSGPAECIVHGFFPLMVSEHDLTGSLFPGGKTGDIFLKDEKGFKFPVITDTHKRTNIMNSRELCLLGYVPDIIKAGVSCLRIEAGTYDAETTGKITKEYREAIDDAVCGRQNEKRCQGEHTTGHYFRGVL